MNSIWYSLIWKEWHEHKWKLVSIAAVLLGCTSLPMLYFDRDMFAGAMAFLFISIVPMTVFVGLGIAANERSRRTLAFMQALPAPMWRLALSKLAVAFVTVFVPILLALGWIYLWQVGAPLLGVNVQAALDELEKGIFFSGNWCFDGLLVATAVTASMLIWSAAGGVNRKDEVSAGAVALGLMLGWYLTLMAIGSAFLAWDERTSFERPIAKLLVAIGLSTAPLGFAPALAAQRQNYPPTWIIAVVACATHFALACLYTWRFGRIENVEVRSPQAADRRVQMREWLGSPRKSPLTAIAWKQARESGVLVLVGLAAVAGFVLLLVAGNPERYAQTTRLAGMIAGATVSMGLGIALIVGIGVCLHDMGPQLNTFWRSRPINPDMYFLCKFFTGLFVLMAALYVPILLFYWLLDPEPRSVLSHPESMIFPALHVAIFATAVLMTVLVRHAVYAAILSIAVVYLGLLMYLGIWLLSGMLGIVPLNPRWWEPTEWQVAFAMLMTFVTSTLLAWLATRYDWGRKSRY